METIIRDIRKLLEEWDKYKNLEPHEIPSHIQFKELRSIARAIQWNLKEGGNTIKQLLTEEETAKVQWIIDRLENGGLED